MAPSNVGNLDTDNANWEIEDCLANVAGNSQNFRIVDLEWNLNGRNGNRTRKARPS
jgi:hypothetical protein